MGKRLSEAEMARYERDGFLYPIASERAFHAAAVARFREANREETRRYQRTAS